MSRVILRGVGLGYQYPGASASVFSDIDVIVRAGHLTAVVGPSGVGKSTLLHVLAGHRSPTCGRVMSNEAATRRRVALVPQDHRLLPWRTAIGNVEVPLLAGKLPRAQRRNRAYEALRQVQAAHFASEPVCKLSGGMQRRVVIARALAVNPEVLLLDEPFSAVDWWTRRGLHEELATLVATGDLGAVLVTHDLDEAVRLADEVLVLVGYPARVGAALPVDVARDERDSPEGAHSLIAVRAAALRAMQLGAPVKATEISSNQT